jgi:cation diffusion facilitator family transporter
MSEHHNGHPDLSHDHQHDEHVHGNNHEAHSHSHGLVDPSIVRSKEGVRAVSISFAVLMIASIIQIILFGLSHSVALLADVIHNSGDSLTAIPLGLAFYLQSKKGERWAGYSIVFVILASALAALYQVIEKFIHPQTPTHIWAIIAAGIVGVVGNELAAVIRWRAGKKLNSPALIADGNHAKADGYVSAGVIVGAIFIAIGLPVADPIIGLIITGLILQSSWQSWNTIRNS